MFWGWIYDLRVGLTVWSSWIYILARACWWCPNKAETGTHWLGFEHHHHFMSLCVLYAYMFNNYTLFNSIGSTIQPKTTVWEMLTFSVTEYWLCFSVGYYNMTLNSGIHSILWGDSPGFAQCTHGGTSSLSISGVRCGASAIVGSRVAWHSEPNIHSILRGNSQELHRSVNFSIPLGAEFL